MTSYLLIRLFFLPKPVYIYFLNSQHIRHERLVESFSLAIPGSTFHVISYPKQIWSQIEMSIIRHYRKDVTYSLLINHIEIYVYVIHALNSFQGVVGKHWDIFLFIFGNLCDLTLKLYLKKKLSRLQSYFVVLRQDNYYSLKTILPLINKTKHLLEEGFSYKFLITQDEFLIRVNKMLISYQIYYLFVSITFLNLKSGNEFWNSQVKQ